MEGPPRRPFSLPGAGVDVASAKPQAAHGMSEENVGQSRWRLGLTVRAFARRRPRLARPVCTECVPPCRRLLAVKQAPEPRLVGRSDATTRRRPEMRAHTKKKHEMGKRFAIVIGVAAARRDGARGADRDGAAAAQPGRRQVRHEADDHHGAGDAAYATARCGQTAAGSAWRGRRVILFKQQPGADRKLGADRSGSAGWITGRPRADAGACGDSVAKVTLKPAKAGRSRVCQGVAQGGRWVRVPRRPLADLRRDCAGSAIRLPEAAGLRE